MDIPDDPSTTTTTTDYDSGDSEGVDYVYEGQIGAEQKGAQGKDLRRRRSRRVKSRGPLTFECVCGTGCVGDDAEITVFEEDSDFEVGQSQQRRPSIPRTSGLESDLECDKKHHRVERGKAIESKARRKQNPYVEEYPDGRPRPTILLREHKIPRRSSTSDAKRVQDSEDRSLSSGSKGTSSTGKHLPPRPPQRRSRKSPQHPGHRRHRLHIHSTQEDKYMDSEAHAFQTADRPRSATGRLLVDSTQEPISVATRGLARDTAPDTSYSSSWPLRTGFHLRQRRARRRGPEYEVEEKRNEHCLHGCDDYDGSRRLRQTRGLILWKRNPEGEREQGRELVFRELPLQERERGRREILSSRPRPGTIVSRTSMTTMDQGYRSVATALCEVWPSHDADWESPYASADEEDRDSDIDEPIKLLRMEDTLSRRSSPRLLPPRGDRQHFSFQATDLSPPPDFPYHSYMAEPLPAPTPEIYHTHPWPASPTHNQVFLLDGPTVLTTEPHAMTDDEGVHATLSPSRASLQLRRGLSRGGRAWAHQHTPVPRSRAASPVFSARRTREFLSPMPPRVARFDFGAWDCDQGSRGSLGLGLL